MEHTTNPINSGTETQDVNPAAETLRAFAKFADNKNNGTPPPPPGNGDTPPPADPATPPPANPQPTDFFSSAVNELFDEQSRAGITQENFLAKLKERMTSTQAQPSQQNVRDDIDEDVLKQSAFYKATGIKNHELYERISAKDKSAMAPIDWALLGFELQTAESGVTLSSQARERQKEKILKQYGVYEDEDNPVDPIDKQLGEANLALEARKVQDKINEIFKKVEESVPDRSKAEAERTENYTKWDTAMASELTNKDNRKITLKINLGNEENQLLKGDMDIDFEIPEADYQNYLKAFSNYAKNQWKFGDYKGALKENLERMAWEQHKGTIMTNLARMAMEKTHQALIAGSTNTPPGGIKNTDTPPPTFDPNGKRQGLEKWLEHNKK